MATTTTSSPLLALPEDLLLRVLIGVPRADHGATAAACGAFRAVMSGPRFLRLRREWGFAERGIVLAEAEVGHLGTERHRVQIIYFFCMMIGCRTRSGIGLGSGGPLRRMRRFLGLPR